MILGNGASSTGAMLREEIDRRGPWFHNMVVGGLPTAPDHFLGDYPGVKWRHLADRLPSDLEGRTVLDIGCNAGFYAQMFAQRGASHVVGIDTSDHYLEQARFASRINGLQIDFRKLSVYQLDQLEETFDIVLFLGVFYHLRYPLFALDRVVEKVRGQLIFQSLIRPRAEGMRSYPPAEEYPFDEQSVFQQGKDFPRMQFIERSFGGDPTNWWLPNAPCAEAVLRSAGLTIVDHPEDETWLCEPDRHRTRGHELQHQELAGLRG